MLLDILTEFLRIFDRSNTANAAYKAAWKVRVETGDDSLDTLFDEMKRRSIVGAYDPLDSPRVLPLIAAWQGGISPKLARPAIRRRPYRLK